MGVVVAELENRDRVLGWALVDGIEQMGATRETRYDEEYVREKYRKAREMGWTIIS